jgi:hypothetical protein
MSAAKKGNYDLEIHNNSAKQKKNPNSSQWHNHSTNIMALRSTQPSTEMSTRNLPGSKGWLVREADNLTTITESIVYKMWEREVTTEGALPFHAVKCYFPCRSMDCTSKLNQVIYWFRNIKKR